jgi:hypothetical protein
MTKFARCVNKLQVDIFGRNAFRLRNQRFAQRNDTLGRARTATFDHQKVFTNNAVMLESTHGGDVLGIRVDFCGGIAVLLSFFVVQAFAQSINLFVDFCAVMIAFLTSTGNRVLNTGRMPRADTRDFAETAMRFARQTGDAPARDDAFDAFAFGDANDVDHFVGGEDGVDGDFLFEESFGEIDFFSDGVATVDLNFHDVGFALTDVDFVDLGVGDDADDGGVFLDAFEGGVEFGAVSFQTGRVFGEGFFLGAVPVFIKAAFDLIGEFSGPNGLERTEALRSFSVANNANNNHRGSFNDGDGFDDFTLLLGARAGSITKHVCVAGLVAHKGGQVWGFGRGILGERTNAAAVVRRTFARQKAKRAMAGRLRKEKKKKGKRKRNETVSSPTP